MKSQRYRKPLSVLLSIAMVLTLVPSQALAEALGEEELIPLEVSEGDATEPVGQGEEQTWEDVDNDVRYTYTTGEYDEFSTEGVRVTKIDVMSEHEQASIDLVIPDTLGDLPVVAIGAGGWSVFLNNSYNKALRTVTIPSSVRSLAESTFSDESYRLNIKEVVFAPGNQITEIPRGCFYRLSIESIELPEGVTTIGERAFFSCNKLASVTFPAALNTIDRFAFEYCNALVSLDIPEGTTSIGDYAFLASTGLGESNGNFTYDFASSSVLTSVELPNSLVSIGKEAFYGHIKLSTVSFGTSMTEANLQTIGEGAFAGTSLTSIEIPDSVTAIGARAFDWEPYREGMPNYLYNFFREGPTTLASIKLGSSQEASQLRTIGANAFRDATITEIALPNTLESLGYTISSNGNESAFEGCWNLRTIAWPTAQMAGSFTTVGGFWDCYNLEDDDVVNKLPSWIDTIDDYAFTNNSFTNIVIPDSVTSIGKRAFQHSEGGTGERYYEHDWDEHRGMSSVTIGASVASVGEEAFCGNYGLTSLVIKDGTTPLVIGDRAFEYSYDLDGVDIVLPKRVTYLGEAVFWRCGDNSDVEDYDGHNRYYLYNKDIKFKCYDEAYADDDPDDPWWRSSDQTSTVYYPQDADSDSDTMRLKADYDKWFGADSFYQGHVGLRWEPFDPDDMTVRHSITVTVPDGSTTRLYVDGEERAPQWNDNTFTYQAAEGSKVSVMLMLDGYKDKVFSPEEGEAVGTLSADWTLTVTTADLTPLSELGTLQVHTVGSYAQDANVAVFDEGGKLVTQGKVLLARVFVVDDIPAGTYRVYAWQDNSYFSRIASPADFAALGLGDDTYATAQVTVAAREAKQVELTVPQLDTSHVADVLVAGELVLPSGRIVPGVSFFAHLSYELADGRTADALTINIPEGMEPLSAASVSKKYGVDGWDEEMGTLTLTNLASADQKGSKISLCLRVNDPGEYAISASLTSGNVTIPVGSARVETQALELMVPQGTLSSAEFKVDVYGEPGKTVRFAIGDTALATTCTTNAVGHGKATLEIPEAEMGDYALYQVTATMGEADAAVSTTELVEFHSAVEAPYQPTVRQFYFEHAAQRVYLVKDGEDVSDGSYVVLAVPSAHPDKYYSQTWPFTVVLDSLQPLEDTLVLQLGMADESVHDGLDMQLQSTEELDNGATRYTYTYDLPVGDGDPLHNLPASDIPVRFDVVAQPVEDGPTVYPTLTQANVNALKRSQVSILSETDELVAAAIERYYASLPEEVREAVTSGLEPVDPNPDFDTVFGLFNASYHHEVWDPEGTMWGTLTDEERQTLLDTEDALDKAYDALAQMLGDKKPLYRYASLQDYLEDNYGYETGQSYNLAALEQQGYFVIHDNDVASVPGAGIVGADGTMTTPAWMATLLSIPGLSTGSRGQELLGEPNDPDGHGSISTKMETGVGGTMGVDEGDFVDSDEYYSALGHANDSVGLALNNVPSGATKYIGGGANVAMSVYFTAENGARSIRHAGDVYSELVDRKNERKRIVAMEEYYAQHNPNSKCRRWLQAELEVLDTYIKDLRLELAISTKCTTEGAVCGTMSSVAGGIALKSGNLLAAKVATLSTVGGGIVTVHGIVGRAILVPHIDEHLAELKRLRAYREQECKKDAFGKLHYKKTAIMDPSGYTYEGVEDERVSEVKATIYQMIGEEWVQWDAGEYDQENPEYTSDAGLFAWDVPIGTWRVLFSKEGYEDVWSDPMEVLPEWINVAINMLRCNAPTVAYADVDGAYEYVDVTFDQYMLVDDAPTLTVNGNDVGSYSWLDVRAGYDRDGNDVDLSRTLRVPIASVAKPGTQLELVVDGAKSYTGKEQEEPYTLTVVRPKQRTTWERVWGQTALDTMQGIAAEFGSAKAAVVTTNADWHDALAASAYAGQLGGPVLTTAKGSASKQTKAALKKAGVKTVYVVGRTADVSKSAMDGLKYAGGVAAKRVADKSGVSAKAIELAKLCTRHGDTVIIASQANFKDALSIASYSYATKSPILYAETSKKLSDATLKYVKGQKYKRALIVGGPVALPASIETQLTKSAGIKAANVTRLAGLDSYATSEVIARWATGQYGNGASVGTYNGSALAYVRFQPSSKMSANRLAVASSQNWKDALCGAALCGRNGSVLLLADDKTEKSDHARAAGFCHESAAAMAGAYVLGGEASVSPQVWDALVASTVV